MNSFFKAVTKFDAYAQDFNINFEKGVLAYNNNGHHGMRVHKNVLGHAIQ